MLDQTFTFQNQNLDYQKLTINKNKLKKLAQQAASIREPELYGSYYDDSHYLETLELVLNSTNEVSLIQFFLTEFLLPRLKKTHYLLDVGCGDGQVLSSIYKIFNHITLVDINQRSLDATYKRLNNEDSPELAKNNCSLLNYEPSHPCMEFDLILMSHVLYHIEQKKWIETLRKYFNFLAPGGIIFIALGGDSHGKAELINHFGGDSINIEQIKTNCIETFGESNISLFSTKSIFYSYDLPTLMHIAGFFLHDAAVTAPKNHLSNYIEQSCPLNSNYYSITSQQKFILIQNNI